MNKRAHLMRHHPVIMQPEQIYIQSALQTNGSVIKVKIVQSLEVLQPVIVIT